MFEEDQILTTQKTLSFLTLRHSDFKTFRPLDLYQTTQIVKKNEHSG